MGCFATVFFFGIERGKGVSGRGCLAVGPGGDGEGLLGCWVYGFGFGKGEG